MIIYEGPGFLGFCRCGDKAWTTIETHNGRFMDITYFNDQFYAVNTQGMIYVCDVGGRNPTEASLLAVKYNTLLPQMKKGDLT